MAVKVHWFQIEPNLKEYEYEFTGLSTDEKPQDERVAANSLFLELDTGDFYYLKQAASSSVVRTEVLEETRFQPIDIDLEYFIYPFSDTQVDMGTGLAEDNYKVVYDGQTYSVDKVVIDDVNYYGSSSYSFIDYPFVITCRWVPRDGYIANISVPNMNEHTIEIYTEETVTTEAVWEKVGSGSQSDGYEINNPTLTMNIDNNAGISTEYFIIYFVNDDGYLSLSEKGVSAGSGSEEKTLVIGRLEDDDIDYGYILHDNPNQVSGETNCGFYSGENVIRITDPTEDASIALTYGGVN